MISHFYMYRLKDSSVWGKSDKNPFEDKSIASRIVEAQKYTIYYDLGEVIKTEIWKKT